MKAATTAKVDEGKALARVREFEKEIESALKALVPLEGDENAIADDDAYRVACETLLDIKARQQVLAEEHAGFLADVKKLLARVDSWFKPAREKHAHAEAILKQAIRDYVIRTETKAKALRKAALKLGARDEEKRESLHQQADETSAPKVTGISFVHKLEVEVVDFGKLPPDFKVMVADEDKIKIAVERGEDVPGVRWKDARTVRVEPKRAGREVA